MNCPKCGLQAVLDQKFCRSCGESLQLITQRLQKPSALSELESQIPAHMREQRGRTNTLLSWGFIVMFIGVAVGVVGKKLMHDELVTVVGILVSLAGMFLTVYPYILPPNRSKHGAHPSSQLQSEPKESLLQEGGTIEYVPGVTERTTDLLTNSAVPRKRAEVKRSQE